jgi:hypothetical protein
VRVLTVAVALLMTVSVAHAAGPFDGSVPLKCQIQTAYVCSDPTICVRGNADTVQLPPVLLVDLNRRVVGGDASGRTAKIVAVGHGPGRLLLHGEEIEMGGTAWNVVIEEASGKMIGAVLSRASGFLLFGVCSGS